MLSDEVRSKLKQAYWRGRFSDANVFISKDDRGLRGLNEPLIPYLKFKKTRVYN